MSRCVAGRMLATACCRPAAWPSVFGHAFSPTAAAPAPCLLPLLLLHVRLLQGLDVLAPYQLPGNLARPRRYEVAAAVNRIRTLRVTQASRPQAIQQLRER